MLLISSSYFSSETSKSDFLQRCFALSRPLVIWLNFRFPLLPNKLLSKNCGRPFWNFKYANLVLKCYFSEDSKLKICQLHAFFANNKVHFFIKTAQKARQILGHRWPRIFCQVVSFRKVKTRSDSNFELKDSLGGPAAISFTLLRPFSG